MTKDDDEGVTLGEVWRRQVSWEADLRAISRDLTEIKTTLASQGVRVGVVWAGLGVGSSALILTAVNFVFVMSKGG